MGDTKIVLGDLLHDAPSAEETLPAMRRKLAQAAGIAEAHTQMGFRPTGTKAMTPEKTKVVNGHTIEQYYWAGRYPVYIDGSLTDETFDEAVERLAADSIGLKQ